MKLYSKLISVILVAVLITSFVNFSKVSAQSEERLDVPFYKQLWAPWAKEKLGSSSETIEDSGCALTSLAMVFKYYGIDTDPEKLNNWLQNNNGYLNGDLLIWSKAAQMAGNKVSYKGMFNYSDIADMDYINSLLDGGYPVIARTNLQGSSHFVVITGRSGSKYFVNDPIYENPARTLNEYYVPKDNPAAAIKEIVVFTSNYPTPSRVPVRKVQSVFSEGSYAIVQPIKNPEMTLQLNNPKITVNKTLKPIDKTSSVSPILYKDRTMIPIRAVLEEMGGTVSWDDVNQKITIDVQGRKIELWVGMRTYFVNGWEFELDAEPVVVNNRTLLPLRAVLEKLGCTVAWEQKTQKITIPSNK